MCKERQSGTEEWTNEQWCDMERDSPYFYACLCPFGGKVFVFVFFFSLSLSKDCHCNVVGKTGWRCFLVVDVEPGSNVKTLLSGVVVEVFSRTSGTDVVLQDKYALKVSFQSGQEVHRDTWCGGKHICKPGIAEPMIAVCFPFCCLYRGSHRLLYIWASGWSKELYWHNSSVNTNSHTPFFFLLL